MNLAYVAGLLDGEGCIGFTQCRTNMIPRIIITNTNKELIEMLYKEFGGCIRAAKKGKEHWKSAYHWVVTSKLAISFLIKIQKYLILKYDQALCLNLYEAIRPGKGKKWTEDGKEAMILLKEQIHWLNKKGANNEKEPMQIVLDEIAYSEARRGKKRK
jgi:hypothetical protein